MPIHCVFCDIIAGKAPASIVYEDKHVVAFLDFQPINEGHCIVATKRHVAYLRELDPAIGARLFKTAQRIEPALEASGLPCDGTNLYLADHPIAGQKVFHVHLHVFPRHAGDAVRIDLGQSQRPERAVLDATAVRLRAHIEGGAPPAGDQHWIVGGEYTDTTFTTLADGTTEQRIGPFASSEAARRVWAGLAQKSVDDAHVRYHLERDGSVEYWVVGGTYTDTNFRQTVGGVAEERLGPFVTYDAALEAWRGKAWATADDGHVRFRIERD